LKHTVEECGTILSVLNSLLENNSELSEDEVVARLSGKIKYRGKQIQNLSDLRAAISTKTMFVTLYLDQGFAGSRIERQNITSSGECALPGKSSQITYNPVLKMIHPPLTPNSAREWIRKCPQARLITRPASLNTEEMAILQMSFAVA